MKNLEDNMAFVFSNVTGDISHNFVECFDNNFLKEQLDVICKETKTKYVCHGGVASNNDDIHQAETICLQGNLETIVGVHEKLMDLLILYGDFTKLVSRNNENDNVVPNLRKFKCPKPPRSLTQIINNITEQKVKTSMPDLDNCVSPVDANETDSDSAEDMTSGLTSADCSGTQSIINSISSGQDIDRSKSKRSRKQARPYNLRKNINQSWKLTFLKLKKPEPEKNTPHSRCKNIKSNNCESAENDCKRTVVTRSRHCLSQSSKPTSHDSELDKKGLKSLSHACDFCDYKCGIASLLHEHREKEHKRKCKKNSNSKENMSSRKINPLKVNKINPEEKIDKLSRFSCEKCDFLTNSQSNLKQHLQRIHIGIASKDYPCGICGKIFGYSKGLKRHLKSHERKMEKLRNMPAEYNCEHCNYTSKKALHLKEHMRRKHMDVTNQIFQCDECGKSFGYPKGLKRHKKTHEVQKQLKLARRNEPVSLNCAHCKYTAKKKIHLFEHMRRNHMDITNKSFPCAKCGKFYGFRKDLNRHMKIHEEPSIVCEECGNLYKSMTALKYHMKTHDENTASTRFHCKMCPRSFKQRGTLNLHFKNIHLGIRDCFLCQTCGKSFCRKASYIAHMNVHLGKKPHVCEICGKAFSYVKSIIEHRRTHSEVRAFQCDICPKTFRLSSALYKHKQIHGEGKHACTVCRKSFRDKSSLRQHERIHSGVKPFTCKICLIPFSDRSHAQKHLVATHEIQLENWKQYIKSELPRPPKRFIERVESDEALNDVYFSIAHPKRVTLSGLQEAVPISPVNIEMSNEESGGACIIPQNSSECTKLSSEMSGEVTEEVYTVPNLPSPETAIECSLSDQSTFSTDNVIGSANTVSEKNMPVSLDLDKTCQAEATLQDHKQSCVEEEVSLATVASMTDTLHVCPDSTSAKVSGNIVYLGEKDETQASSSYTETPVTSTYIMKDFEQSIQVDNYNTHASVEESVIATNIIRDCQEASFGNSADTVSNVQQNEAIAGNEQLVFATESGEQFSQIIIVEEIDGQVIYTMSR